MTKEEYYEELKAVEMMYETEKRKVYTKYATANNPYKIGDLITDHSKTIQIQKIQITKSYDLPECVYTGLQLNKDGKPNKKQDNNVIYQSNIITNQ